VKKSAVKPYKFLKASAQRTVASDFLSRFSGIF
jgi:hypothetical protein